MKPYDIYVFFLCLIVFTALTALFTYLIAEIIKLTVKVIKNGLEDDKIIAEHETPKKEVGNKVVNIVISIILLCILLFSFVFSIWLHVSEDVFTNSMNLKVVASSSMSEKHKRNTYLVENNLDTQFDTFDLIVTHPIPEEFELNLYDVVVYEYEDLFIIHRIVGIEEPNNKHPGHRLFITQGDAIGAPDRDPVTYEQMRAIYYGEKVRFVGSFVFFMKSPAGWLCILLILFGIIATPIVEKKIHKEIMYRLYELGIISAEELDMVTRKKVLGRKNE